MIALRIPLEIEKIVEITDPIYTFNEIIDQIDLTQFYKGKMSVIGRPRYDAEKLMKVALFAFMENGYASLRDIEHLCKTDIRYIWLLGGENAPSHMTVCNFLNDYVGSNISELFTEINRIVFEKEGVDLSRLYIDGTKIEANANKYSWVWKKSCQTSRAKVFVRISEIIEEINSGVLRMLGLRIEPREEYAIEYLEQVIERFASATDAATPAKHGRGHHKTAEQRQYDKLCEYLERLKKYAERIEICGEHRNSFSKTDHDATFMRVKRDYMGNDQLLPAYNMQIGVCDEYIAVVDAQQFASDMDCFVPLLEKFRNAYGEYPLYPVGDAGYGSYNNYLFCEQNGIGKYMKFTMYDKESRDPKFREDPYRAVNFERDEDGNLVCPEGRPFEFLGNRPVRGNHYGRTEEIYKCSSCDGCPSREKCCRGDSDRTIRMNRELTAIHHEVLENLQTELGARLRTNRTIQAEGAFGSIKWNRAYKRARRRGIESVILEFTLIAIGFNLYKYHNKKQRAAVAA
ncbi:IS1182 family transposase [bacterium]|nr:IS1182 family transposase [bacterium]